MSPVKNNNYSASSPISEKSSHFLPPTSAHKQQKKHNPVPLNQSKSSDLPQNLSTLDFRMDHDNLPENPNHNLYGETDRLLNHKINQTSSEDESKTSHEDSISPTEKLLSEENTSDIDGNENEDDTKKVETQDKMNNSDTCMSEMLESVRYGYNQHLLASSKALENQYMNLIKDFKSKQKQALSKQKEQITRKFQKETDKIKKSYEDMYAEKMRAAATKMNAASKKLHEDYLHKKQILENQLKLSTARCSSFEQELTTKRQLLTKMENELGQTKHSLEKCQIQNKTNLNCNAQMKSDVKKLEESNNKLKLESQDLRIKLDDSNKINDNLSIQLKNSEKNYSEIEQNLRIENKNLSEQVEELNEDVEILCASLQDYENFRKEFKVLEANNTNLTEKVEGLEQINQKMEKDLSVSKQNYHNLQNHELETVNELKTDLSSKDKHIKNMTNNLSKLELSLKESQCEQLELTKKLEKKEKIIIKFEDDISKQTMLVEKLRNEKDQLIESNHQLNDEIDADRKRQSELNHKFELACNSKEIEIERLKSQQRDTIEHLEKITNKLKEKVNDQEQLENQMTILQNEKIKLEQNYATLKAQSDSSLAMFQMKNIELKSQLDQMSQDNNALLNIRRKLEADLVNSASEKDRAEHGFERQIRKFDFLQDEIQQIKSLYEKERFKNETISREHIILSDEVTSLRGKNEALISEVQVLESKCDKSNKNTQKIKEKIKSYKKNLNSAHDLELTHLKGTIEVLKNKLESKDQKQVENVKESEKRLKESEKRKFQLKIDHLDTYVKTLEAKNQDLQGKLLVNEKGPSPVRKKQKSIISEVQQEVAVVDRNYIEKPKVPTTSLPESSSSRKNSIKKPTNYTSEKSENQIHPQQAGAKSRTKGLQNAQQIIAKHSKNFRKPLAIVDTNITHKTRPIKTLDKIIEKPEIVEEKRNDKDLKDQSIEDNGEEVNQTPLLKKIDHKRMATRSTRTSRRLIT